MTNPHLPFAHFGSFGRDACALSRDPAFAPESPWSFQYGTNEGLYENWCLVVWHADFTSYEEYRTGVRVCQRL